MRPHYGNRGLHDDQAADARGFLGRLLQATWRIRAATRAEIRVTWKDLLAMPLVHLRALGPFL